MNTIDELINLVRPSEEIKMYEEEASEREILALEARKQGRENEVVYKIPSDFLKPIDRARKTIDWQAFDKIQDWDGKRSITARGVSQVGKSRAIYQVLRREFVEHGRNFLIVDEFKLITKTSDAAKNGELDSLSRKWNDVDILFFDDIDKVNFSQGVTGKNALTLVFGAIKYRMASEKPTIMSYNLALKDFFAEAGAQTFNSLVERIKQKEHWLSVEFKKPK